MFLFFAKHFSTLSKNLIISVVTFIWYATVVNQYLTIEFLDP